VTSDRHARVKKIFLDACALPPDGRSTFLSKACEGDVPLFTEVQRLLAHHIHENANQSEDRPGAASAAPSLSELPVFPPGHIVAGRYRIVCPLGEGAMGRVFRAEDLSLKQDVALKFLPVLHGLDPIWRRRVETEVRLSREVSHPSICRVYDLAEVDGMPFISMEYIDGEDLASLLHRVGRLTGPRAIDISRQICAGLAAAHVHGVLHRDLKPANVMLDSRGRVRITDFGLAVVAGHVERAEIRAGTPRYMAPEQLAGVCVNEKSDLYSLGLVLYEMFTGRPAFNADSAMEYLRLHLDEAPAPPSDIVPEIDPQVEAVILACIRKDPDERPESALHVAAALPGGDLLAAALDAGQIPTRQMLAESAAEKVINKSRMYHAAVAALVLFIMATFLGRGTHPIAKDGGVKSPDVLIEKAREVSRLAGHGPATGAIEGRYLPSADTVFPRIVSTISGPNFRPAVPTGVELLFRYRENSEYSLPSTGDGLSIVMPETAGLHDESASIAVTTTILDGGGRLLFFESKATPASTLHSAASATGWQSLVRASGHDPQDLLPTASVVIPQVHVDEQRAFRARSSHEPVRIEIASRRGSVQFFAVLSESTDKSNAALSSGEIVWSRVRTARNTVLLLLLAAAIPSAWKNSRNGGDVIGSARLGCFIVVIRLVGALLAMQNVGNFSENIENAAHSAVTALSEGLIVAIFYLAIELQVRRLWPRTLVCWSRLIAGRLRDPNVGRDVLLGCVVGFFWASLMFLDRRIPTWMCWEARTQLRMFQGLDDLLGARFAFAGMLDTVRSGVYQGLVTLFLLVMATWFAGPRRWLTVLIVWLIAAVMYAPAASHPVTAWTLFAFGGVAVALYALMHWGLVSLLTALSVLGLLSAFPITTDLKAWYAGYGLFAAAATLGLALWGFLEALRPPGRAALHPSAI